MPRIDKDNIAIEQFITKCIEFSVDHIVKKLKEDGHELSASSLLTVVLLTDDYKKRLTEVITNEILVEPETYNSNFIQ